MKAIWHEMRQAVSQLRHSPGFTLLAVLILGLGLGAIGFARLLSSELRGVAPFDPPTLLGVALGLAAIALLASLFPALRALRVNPTEALRHE